MILPETYYLSHDVTAISRDLLGKYLFTCVDGELTGGMIVETEAYSGVTDKASHAYSGRRTARTETMYSQGGVSYVYLCYGIHEMFNVVTATEGTPHAVLIRGIEPVEGIDVMLCRRGMPVLKNNLTAGPGSVAKALGITRKLNNYSLLSDFIWIEDRGVTLSEDAIKATTRIGVSYAAEDALLPYRFYIKGNPYVSKPNK